LHFTICPFADGSEAAAILLVVLGGLLFNCTERCRIVLKIGFLGGFPEDA
jgi:hypothetical protein